MNVSRMEWFPGDDSIAVEMTSNGESKIRLQTMFIHCCVLCNLAGYIFGSDKLDEFYRNRIVV